MESMNCSISDQCSNGSQLHVVMMTWLSHDHISSFIQLSKRLLDRKNIKISFVSTPLNIAKTKLSFQEKQGNQNLVELPLPCVDGLSSGIENTSHLPTHLIFLFHEAERGLEKPLQTLLEQISPDLITGSLVVPVGALLPRPYPVKQNSPEESEHECLRWLERQRPASVFYVSFGSECSLSEEQIEEIAQGLEASLQPFLWILRFPNNLDEDGDEVQRR
ncbi:hypothetical protein KI387_009626, partial [Taxus chinensis]